MMQFEIPKERPSIIKVIGVGGGGSNAVNYMYRLGIKGVDFLVCNTDHQALEVSPVPFKIQLGPSLTEGRGAGALPEVGKNAAIENIEEIRHALRENTRMVFITAGMGGGTGTGAAPIIAGVAREMGILTVGIVTVPFAFEGKKRKAQADAGIEELKKNVDTLLIICNDKLREIYGDLKLTEAFGHADNILSIAAKSIAETISITMRINVDFADIQTVMKDSGVAIMGSASASGENRAIEAVKKALDSPLLNDNEIEGARYILLNITSGSPEVTMDEVGEITDYIQEKAGMTADVIMGVGNDESLGENVNVTIVATGFKTRDQLETVIDKPVEKIVYDLDGKVLKDTSRPEPAPATPPVEVTQSVAGQNEPVLIIREPEVKKPEPVVAGKTISDIQPEMRPVVAPGEPVLIIREPEVNMPEPVVAEKTISEIQPEMRPIAEPGEPVRITPEPAVSKTEPVVAEATVVSVQQGLTASAIDQPASPHFIAPVQVQDEPVSQVRPAVELPDNGVSERAELISDALPEVSDVHETLSASVDQDIWPAPVEKALPVHDPEQVMFTLRESREQDSPVVPEIPVVETTPAADEVTIQPVVAETAEALKGDHADLSVEPETGSLPEAETQAPTFVFEINQPVVTEPETNHSAISGENQIIPMQEKTQSPNENDRDLVTRRVHEPVLNNVVSRPADPPEIHEDDPYQRAKERINQLKAMSMKMNAPGGIIDLEKEPAYKRRNIQLDHVPDAGEAPVSRFTLTNDAENKPEIKSNNSFLHDRVD